MKFNSLHMNYLNWNEKKSNHVFAIAEHDNRIVINSCANIEEKYSIWQELKLFK